MTFVIIYFHNQNIKMPENVWYTTELTAWHCNEDHSHAVSNGCEFVRVWFSAVINYNQSTEDRKTVPIFQADEL